MNIFMYLFRWRKGGALFYYVYIGTHNKPFLQNHFMDVYEIWAISAPWGSCYSLKCIICINLCNIHVYKWENAYIKDLYSWRF